MGLVLLIDPHARHVEWSGGVAVSLRGGYAPLIPGQVSEPALRLSINPTAAMLYEDRVRRRRLQLDYSPLIYLRASRQYYERSQVRRPLLFHSLRTSYGADISPILRWQAAVGGTLGESDYSLQASQLGTDPSTDDGSSPGGLQGSLLDQPVVRTGALVGGVSLVATPHPLHALTVGPSFAVRRLLSDVPAESGAAGLTFDQTSGDLALGHRYAASAVDSLSTTVLGGYADFGVNGSQAYSSAGTSWRRRLRPWLDSEVTAGAFVTIQVRPREGNTPVPVGLPVLPTVDYLLAGRVLQRRLLRISTNVNVGTRAYFDPVQGSVLPLAGGGGRVDFEFPPDVAFGVSANFYTPPTPPGELEANTAGAGRTTLTVQAPVTIRLGPRYSMEVGALFTGRGPHLSQVDVAGAFPQTEYWLYVSFNAFFTSQGS